VQMTVRKHRIPTEGLKLGYLLREFARLDGPKTQNPDRGIETLHAPMSSAVSSGPKTQNPDRGIETPRDRGGRRGPDQSENTESRPRD